MNTPVTSRTLCATGGTTQILPPLHLYKQLRGAYGVSRFGAWLLLFVLTSFGVILVAVGMNG